MSIVSPVVENPEKISNVKSSLNDDNNSTQKDTANTINKGSFKIKYKKQIPIVPVIPKANDFSEIEEIAKTTENEVDKQLENNNQNLEQVDTSNVTEKQIDQLRILLRFNCGSCNYNYSKITSPKYFDKKCKDCKSNCYLVVLRCNDDTLLGGYTCKSCNARFLAPFNFRSLEKFTPYCKNCDLYTKVYQILLNKSKISVRNIKLFFCKRCDKIASKAYFSKGRLIKSNYKKHTYETPMCCNSNMIYWKLRREFKFIKLDDQGNSPSYYETLKYEQEGDNTKLVNINLVEIKKRQLNRKLKLIKDKKQKYSETVKKNFSKSHNYREKIVQLKDVIKSTSDNKENFEDINSNKKLVCSLKEGKKIFQVIKINPETKEKKVIQEQREMEIQDTYKPRK